MKVLKIERPSLGFYFEASVEVAVEELRLTLSEGHEGDQVHFTVVEMEREEYDALPEFLGW